MKWSIRLGRFFGIDVYVHVTFLLLLAWIGWTAWTQAGPVSALVGVGFMLTIFTCVLMHEYGHALTARRYGIATHDITLLPIGGLARLERMPSKPVQELWVAIAGPAVNVVIAAVLWIWLRAGGTGLAIVHYGDSQTSFLGLLMMWNLLMVAFNMLPAFPMDGGRVLRALLAMRMPYARATRVAATIGQGMAMLFGLWGLTGGGPLLLFIALFVWIGASDEAHAAEQTSLLHGLRVRDGMLTDFHAVSPDDTAATVVRLTLQGWQADFPVMSEGRLVGVVTAQDVLTALERNDPSAGVAGFMRAGTAHCEPGEMLEAAVERLRSSGLPLMPVVEGGRVVGLLTPGNVLEVLMFRRALSHAGPVRNPVPA